MRSGDYRYYLAQRKAQERKAQKTRRQSYTPEIQAYVEEKLTIKYSPEQIVGTAKKDGVSCVSHETIYLKIWQNKHQGGKLYQDLRNKGKRYRKRGAAKDNRGKISNRQDIDKRPDIVEERERLGDLEVDLVIGSGHQGALLTINDRVTGRVMIEKLNGKQAEGVSDAIISRLLPFRDHLHTITSDNGKEFAEHEKVAKALQIDFYFAKPYHSWQRGSNENLNGLIRQYIPKEQNISLLTAQFIAEVEQALNDRPRKRHQFLSPQNIHDQLINQHAVALVS
jgi:transposase, IS30 family